MKKLLFGMLACCLALFIWTPQALAFQGEQHIWNKWREHDRHRQHERYQEHRDNHKYVVGYRSNDHFYWYGDHRLSNLRVHYSDHYRNRVIRIGYENYDGMRYLETMRSRHGHYTYRHRIHYEGRDCLAFYWMGRDTIFRVIVADDGYTRVMAWHRSTLEDHAVAIGYVSRSTVHYYGRYYDSMPEEIAAGYIRDVLVED